MAQFEDFRDLPTIMGIGRELEVMSALMGMPVEYIADHEAEFRAVVDDLVESHQGGGYFEVRPGNEGALLRFAAWLEPMLTRFGMPGSMADTFRFTYQDLVEAYPQLRGLDLEDEAAGSRGGSPMGLQAFRDMPTVMAVSAELAVMRALRAMPVEFLVAHRDEFVEIVERLDGSHGSPKGGLFGLTPDNEGAFREFVAWLRELGPVMGWPTTRRWALDVTFAQAAKKYPHLREVAASGPQPGSPVVVQLAERVKEAGELEIAGTGAAWQGVTLLGQGWNFAAGRGWRVVNPDGTLAFAWSTPGVEDLVAGLVGLRVVEVVPQSRVTAADPALRLSDGRWLEVFSGNPLIPWTMRIGSGVFTGAPSASEWV